MYLVKTEETSSNLFTLRQFWLFYFIFAIIEFYLFKQYAFNDVVFFYPRGSDQASYLPLIYQTYENVKQFGLIKGFGASPQLPTGFLFPGQIVLFLLFFGASRFSALLANFTYFILLQVCSLLVLQSLTKKKLLLTFILWIIISHPNAFFKCGW